MSSGGDIEAERKAREQTERLGRAMRRGRPQRVEQALDDDARARGMAAAHEPSPLLVSHLGSVPDDPTARERWVEAAGRIAQHRALWPVQTTCSWARRHSTAGQSML